MREVRVRLDSDSILNATVIQQARLIAQREISCEELTRFYLDRIEKFNAQIQAFVEVYSKDAVRSARDKDRKLRGKQPLHPFHGVPIGIKDLNFVFGKRTRLGSAASLPLPSPFDDSVVSGLRRTGFVILGKLTTSEFGVLPVTEPTIHPPTRNPWNLDYSSGGSSGGSAAAIAAGLLPIAQASDGGGSIRIPASFTGLVGLKPARGRIPEQLWQPDRQILYTNGVITRTLAESVALLDLMSGLIPGSGAGKPHWATPPADLFSNLYQRDPGKLKIRFTLESSVCKTHPEVKTAVMKAVEQLKSLGHELEELSYPEAYVEDFIPLWANLVAKMPLVRWKRTQPVTRWLKEEAKKTTSSTVHQLHLSLEKRILDWFGNSELWLSPTVPIPPPRIGAFSDLEDPRTKFTKLADLGVFTAIANITGQPGISLPAGKFENGLPIGIQLLGAPQGEIKILQVAHQLTAMDPERYSFHFPKNFGVKLANSS